MKVTALYGSPRKDGNTDLLLQAFLRGARRHTGDIHAIALRELSFSACIECAGCNETGTCVLRDDMVGVYPHLAQAEDVVLSAPVFFYGLNALAKAMVDRCQCCWVKKYLLGEPLSILRGCKGSGVLLSVGGSRGKKTFEPVMLTARYFFDALDMDFSHHLTYSGIDAKGSIAEHPAALDEASRLGAQVAQGKTTG